MSDDRRLEILEIFAEAGAHDRISDTRHGGIWRQWQTPYVARAARDQANCDRSLSNYHTDPTAKAANHASKRSQRLKVKLEVQAATEADRRAQDARVKVAAAKLAPDGLMRARVLCTDCRKMPTGVWCFTHERIETMRHKLEKTRGGITHHFTVITRKNPEEMASFDTETMARALWEEHEESLTKFGGPGQDWKDTDQAVWFAKAGAVIQRYITRYEERGLESTEVIEMDGYITANVDASGRLGEFFVRLGKIGSWGAAIDSWAIAMSLCLQHGVPVRKLFGKFEFQQFWPSGGTRNVDIPRCSSICDYVSKWILKSFTGVTNWEVATPITVVDSTEEVTKP